MQEIESRHQIGAQEGAHFIYTLCFLAGTSLIQAKYGDQTCKDINLNLLVSLIFYGLIIWATYLIITLLPNCKNSAIKQFFRFMHAIFGVYMLAVFVYANLLYFDDNYTHSNCPKSAPVLSFFTSLFIFVGYVIFIIFTMSIFSTIFRRFSKQAGYDVDKIEEL